MTAATHAGSFALQPSSQNPSWENWQSSEHNTGAGFMGASAGLKGGDGRTGGAGIEGGEGGLSLTSSHRSFGALKKALTSSIVPPTYTLGMPFTDSPVITSKVCCTAPAKPSARICRPAAHRLNNAKGAGDYLGCVVLRPVPQSPSRPSGSCPHARWPRHLWQSYRRHALGSAAHPKAAAQTSERQGAHPVAACWPQLAAPQILTWSLQRAGGSLACSGGVSVRLAGARLTTWYSGVDGTHTRLHLRRRIP